MVLSQAEQTKALAVLGEPGLVAEPCLGFRHARFFRLRLMSP
jgi:hypothetical protein